MKVKELRNISVVRLIDWYTNKYFDTLPFEEAVQQYGECEVCGHYTDMIMPDGTFKTSIWIKTEEE